MMALTCKIVSGGEDEVQRVEAVFAQARVSNPWPRGI